MARAMSSMSSVRSTPTTRRREPTRGADAGLHGRRPLGMSLAGAVADAAKSNVFFSQGPKVAIDLLPGLNEVYLPRGRDGRGLHCRVNLEKR
jgi:hypothetical protein